MSDLTKKLRELHDMATPGMKANAVYRVLGGRRIEIEGEYEETTDASIHAVVPRVGDFHMGWIDSAPFARLIAESLNALPALLDAVDALEANTCIKCNHPTCTKARAALARLDA